MLPLLLDEYSSHAGALPHQGPTRHPTHDNHATDLHLLSSPTRPYEQGELKGGFAGFATEAIEASPRLQMMVCILPLSCYWYCGGLDSVVSQVHAPSFVTSTHEYKPREHPYLPWIEIFMETHFY